MQRLLLALIDVGDVVLPLLALVAAAALLWVGRRNHFFLPRGFGQSVTATVLLILLLLATAGFVFERSIHRILERRTLGLALTTLDDGRTHRVADWRGHPVLVNYWATWCAPCRRELPALGRFAAAHRSDGLIVLSVTDEAKQEVLPALPELPAAGIAALFADPEPPQGGLAGVVYPWRPVTVLLDREGRPRRLLLGPQTEATLEAAVSPLL